MADNRGLIGLRKRDTGEYLLKPSIARLLKLDGFDEDYYYAFEAKDYMLSGGASNSYILDGEGEIVVDVRKTGTFRVPSNIISRVSSDGKVDIPYTFGKANIIDLNDKKIIKTPWEFIGDFKGKIAPIILERKYGFGYSLGRTIVEPSYDLTFMLDEDTGYARKGEEHFLVKFE